MLVSDTCATLRFSTDCIPEDRRARAVRELHLHERTILPARLDAIEPLDHCPTAHSMSIWPSARCLVWRWCPEHYRDYVTPLDPAGQLRMAKTIFCSASMSGDAAWRVSVTET